MVAWKWVTGRKPNFIRVPLESVSSLTLTIRLTCGVSLEQLIEFASTGTVWVPAISLHCGFACLSLYLLLFVWDCIVGNYTAECQ